MKVEIVRAGPISFALADFDRLDEFKVVVAYGISAEEAAAAMTKAGVGELFSGGYAWVSISWLRSQLSIQATSFWDGFDGMVSYAKSHGWLSHDHDALRAHLEYQASYLTNSPKF